MARREALRAEDVPLEDAESGLEGRGRAGGDPLLPASPRSAARAAARWQVWRRPLAAVGALLLVAAAVPLLGARRPAAGSLPSASGGGRVGLELGCDPHREEVYDGSCYAKCDDLTEGAYPTRAAPATCCKGTGGDCFNIWNLKNSAKFNTRASTPDEAGMCLQDEEAFGGVCYHKCSIRTDGEYPYRTGPDSCCKEDSLSCFGMPTLGVASAASSNGSNQTVPGACTASEESFMGLCYTKCSKLTNGEYSHRVAALTCCNGHGASCGNPVNLRTDVSFGQGGGRPGVHAQCGYEEEVHGGLCYMKCERLTNGTYPNRVGASICCEYNGTKCADSSNYSRSKNVTSGCESNGTKCADSLNLDQGNSKNVTRGCEKNRSKCADPLHNIPNRSDNVTRGCEKNGTKCADPLHNLAQHPKQKR